MPINDLRARPVERLRRRLTGLIFTTFLCSTRAASAALVFLIAIKFLGAVEKERPDLKEIGDILATDPPLSGEVLRLVNSSVYALPHKVTSVFHAVNLLGMNTVKNLALSFALIKRYHDGGGDNFDYPQFWKNSLTAAVSARLIAKRVAPALADDAFSIGLLHDMGLLVLVRCMPDQYRLVIYEMAEHACGRQDAEKKILGFDHMEVGLYLLGQLLPDLSETFEVHGRRPLIASVSRPHPRHLPLFRR